MTNELITLQKIWISKYTDCTDKEIRDAIDLATESINFANEVISICGTFSLRDIYVRKVILDELCDHGKYPLLRIEWDKEVGNFS